MSGFEGYEAAESRIGVGVAAGFDVTCEPIFESRVAADGNDQVVPAVELIERETGRKRFVVWHHASRRNTS